MNEIVDRLFIGSLEDGLAMARFPAWAVVFVHEQYRDEAPPLSHWIPVVQSCVGPNGYFDVEGADRHMLNAATSLIKAYLDQGKNVLVHCAEGIERSPLTVTWFLKRFGYAKTLPEAFAMVQAKRPQALDRLVWLNGRMS